LERRQVQRLAKAYQDQGATALISKKRGRPSNRQMPEDLKAQALAVKQHERRLTIACHFDNEHCAGN
jgi:hypothetical protein